MNRLVGGQYRRYSPWKIIPPRALLSSDSLFSFPARREARLRGRTLQARETRLFRERPDDSWSSRAISPEPFDKSYNIVYRRYYEKEREEKNRGPRKGGGVEVGRRIDRPRS